MKSSGTCPKCNGKEIYSDAGLSKRGDRSCIAYSSWGTLYLDVYVCVSCGYLEEYVRNSDLDETKKQKLASNWKKHVR